MLKPILLVEDNPKDLELTLVALAKSKLANDVVTIRDGAEAIDYLYRRGAHAGERIRHVLQHIEPERDAGVGQPGK